MAIPIQQELERGHVPIYKKRYTRSTQKHASPVSSEATFREVEHGENAQKSRDYLGLKYKH